MRASAHNPKLLGVTAALVFMLVISARRASTPAIRDVGGHVMPRSIAALESVEFGGVEQWLLIRGQDQNKPILLFLHGGPGLALMPLSHVFQRGLEQDFVVVQWDMRGSGKSYHRKLSPDVLREEQLLSDLHDVARYLCARLHQPKLYLVGHSFGTYLGMLAIERYPELFRAFIGVGQLADYVGRAGMERAFILRQAAQRGEFDAVKDLDYDDAKLRRQLVMRFGGDVHAFGGAYPFIKRSLGASEYSWPDYLRYVAGLRLYSWRPELYQPDLTSRVLRVRVPVYFFLGRYDAIAPPELAQSYFASLKAPRKRIIWFEQSAHWPFLEEPAKFREQLLAVVAETQ